MLQSIVFGGGCFWCIEAGMSRLRGVSAVTSGYAGGNVANPTYEEVCAGTTGHAEVVKVDFNPAVINFPDLLGVFFALHDPTTQNRQGNDSGEQYRSVIFTTDDEQLVAAKKYVANLEQQKLFERPIVTEIAPLTVFYPAERNHQQYYDKNPDQGYCSVVISPKLVKLRQHFQTLLKEGV